MVSKNDVKYRKPLTNWGGLMGSTEIVTASENNLYDLVTQPEQAGGFIDYRVFYVINGHATEKMEDCDIWLSSNNSQSSFSYVQWAIDPIALNPIWPFTPSIYLNGDDENLNCGNNAFWDQSLGKMSFSFWIFPIDVGNGFTQYCVDHGGANNLAFRCYLDSSNGTRIHFVIKDAVGVNHEALSDGIISNAWNFVCCVWDDTRTGDEMRIWVNNILGFQTADSPDFPDLTTPLRLGRTGPTDTLKGYIKDFRFFSEKTLTVEQIDDIYNGESDAVAADYWQILNEGSGNAIDEKTAAAATLDNGAEWRTSQKPDASTTSPVGITWQNVTNGPNPTYNSPNLGDLAANAGRQCPIWTKWTVEDTDQDAQNDFCVLTVTGKIPSGGTPDPNPDPDDPQPPPNAGDFTFCATGDWGCDAETTDVVNMIKTQNPKVVLSLGDNSYSSGISCWFDKIKDIDDNQGSGKPRFEMCFGNHDNAEDEASSREGDFKSHFGYSNTYNMFDYENVRFISIDNTTETSFSSGSAQYNQVKDWLKTGRENPNIDWIICYLHKPMFGSPSKHEYSEGNFNTPFFPIFDQYKVDLILSGHNHNWQVSKQVTYNSNNSTSPTVVDSASPYTGGVGRIQVVAGAGGHDHYGIDSLESYMSYEEDGEFGPFVGTVTNSGNTTTLTGKFLDLDGQAQSTFTISRTTT